MNKLSEHFSLEEFTYSDYASRHGIDNNPNQHQLANLYDLALDMERVRDLLGYPIIIKSAFRSPKVNAGIGGAKNSAHMEGLACDFVCPGFGNNINVARAIQKSDILFDQLILEYGWVHFSIADEGKPIRRQCLTKRSANDHYEVGILE